MTDWIFIVTIVSVLVGYYLGTKRSPKDDFINTYTSAKKEISNQFNPQAKVGPIKRPNARELAIRNEDPRVQEEKKALLKSLEESDLKTIKDTVNELKRKGVDVT